METSVSTKKLVRVISLPELRPIWVFWLVALINWLISYLFIENKIWSLVILGVFLLSGAYITWRLYKIGTKSFDQKVSYGRLQSIVTNLEDAVIAYDGDFQILLFNASAEKMFNLPADQIVGKTVGPEKASDPSMRLLVQTLFPSLAPSVVTTTQPNQYPQIVDISFDNPNREFRVSTDRILDDSGQPLGFVKVIRDRTRELGLIKNKTEFVSVAAHQLRTPLSAINWTFESLSTNDKLSDSDKQIIQNGMQATTNLLQTVNDLLDAAEIEEGRFGYNLEQVDLIHFIEEVLSNAQMVAKEYGLQVFFDKGGYEELKVTIDKSKLGLAISNLVDNAMKYNSKNGSVTVRIKNVTQKPYVEISIQDTGIGIPPDAMEKIFTKLYRAPNARKIKADGTGLGLYITKNIINQHGGQIRVESTLGRGTTFIFTLPTDPNLVPRAEAPSL